MSVVGAGAGIENSSVQLPTTHLEEEDPLSEFATPLPLEEVVKRGQKRTYDVFYPTQRLQLPEAPELTKVRVYSKVVDEYARQALPSAVPSIIKLHKVLPSSSLSQRSHLLLTGGGLAPLLLTDGGAATSTTSSTQPSKRPAGAGIGGGVSGVTSTTPILTSSSSSTTTTTTSSSSSTAATAVSDVIAALTARAQPVGIAISQESTEAFKRVEEMTARAAESSRAMIARRAPTKIPTPTWHAPWKLMRVISGHLGWVRSVAVDQGNEWFATGANDRTIKIWDLASGTLKLTLTGHVHNVRGLAVSPRHPYLFSAGEDKTVKCWDLETNRVIRDYHGHLSGIYALALHPTLDILFTGGRDSVCRVWDMRTKSQIHTLAGHENAVASIISNSVDPQVVTGSMDSTIRLWDLAAGKVRSVLTHHKKAVRSLVSHPSEFAFVSGAADNLKKWALPDGVFVSNYAGHNSVINSLAMNEDGVLVSGGDDGSLKLWDYNTGYSFQELKSQVQPGSLESEAGIYAMTFDQTGGRLITCEADKTIKIWKEDTTATAETHPIDMDGWTAFCKQHKYY